jgi:hypothetical protein
MRRKVHELDAGLPIDKQTWTQMWIPAQRALSVNPTILLRED